jgi:hypothetical protein
MKDIPIIMTRSYSARIRLVLMAGATAYARGGSTRSLGGSSRRR